MCGDDANKRVMMFSTTVSADLTIAAGERARSVWHAYAQSELAPSGTMSALALEGCLTALLVCPKEVSIDLWALRPWGDAVPRFQEDAERSAVTAAMIQFKDGIAARILSGRDHYRPACLPVLGRPRLDDVREWVAGFWKIVELQPDWWLRLLEDRKLSTATLPFLGFIPGGDGRCMEETDDNREQLYAHAGSLGIAVLVLDRIRKKRATSAAANPARNARCPCGSGRKFKHCCA